MVWQRGSGYMELIGRRKTGRPQRIVGCSEGGQAEGVEEKNVKDKVRWRKMICCGISSKKKQLRLKHT